MRASFGKVKHGAGTDSADFIGAMATGRTGAGAALLVRGLPAVVKQRLRTALEAEAREVLPRAAEAGTDPGQHLFDRMNMLFAEREAATAYRFCRADWDARCRPRLRRDHRPAPQSRPSGQRPGSDDCRHRAGIWGGGAEPQPARLRERQRRGTESVVTAIVQPVLSRDTSPEIEQRQIEMWRPIERHGSWRWPARCGRRRSSWRVRSSRTRPARVTSSAARSPARALAD